MYNWYRNSYSPSYNYGYPSYGYGTSYYGRNYRNYGYGYGGYGYGGYGSYPYYNSYNYGYGRRRPYYWERDRNTYDSWGSYESTTSPRTPSPEPTPQPPPPVAEVVKELHVKGINLHIPANTKQHRTAEYACTKDREIDGELEEAELVVRRGDKMKMTITFDRPYNKAKNDLELRFTLGKDHSPSRGTQVDVEIDESGKQKFKPDEWGASLQEKTENDNSDNTDDDNTEKNENDVTILVSIPANCIIGQWNLFVKTTSEGKDEDGNDKKLFLKYEHKDDITIIFNPWCKEDGVYMPTEKLLIEYIENESGAVWRGNAYQREAMAWNYGQFEESILDICLHLVRSGFHKDSLKLMSDPVKVCRMITKMVNSQDDKGVLVGNWSGEYEGGKPPWEWVGSTKILRQWKRSGPVKYAQCWVYACVTTTVCRALGIPCRTITNFSSAHETDWTNSIENYFDPDGKELEEYNTDSVWNYHAWNEVWLARPDLKPEFPYGWQVIDATPQEASEDYYQCGPCPVAAIKKGLCTTKYDAAFIFCEVNADKVHWRIYPDGTGVLIEILKNKIGKCISTKTPTGLPFRYGRNERFDYAEERRQDLTLEYKHREGSEAEREAVMMAHETAINPIEATYLTTDKVKYVEFHLYHDNDAMIGTKMNIEFTAKNTGRLERNISYAAIKVEKHMYTGYSTQMLHYESFGGDTYLRPGEEKSFRIVLEPHQYEDELYDQASVRITARAKVESAEDEEEQSVNKEHVVRFKRPDLDVECPEEARVGDTVRFEVSFTNPLDHPLTECRFSMESVGFEDIYDDIRARDVPPRGFHVENVILKAVIPKKYGAVYFSFDCRELPDISGSAYIRIREKRVY